VRLVADLLVALPPACLPACMHACMHACMLQYVFLEEPQRFNAALFRTTAPYLPAGLADELIHREEQARLDKAREQQQPQQQQDPKQRATVGVLH